MHYQFKRVILFVNGNYDLNNSSRGVKRKVIGGHACVCMKLREGLHPKVSVGLHVRLETVKKEIESVRFTHDFTDRLKGASLLPKIIDFFQTRHH